MEIREEELLPLADMLSEISKVPHDRFAGFVVALAIYNEDGSPGGRLIASTPNLRTVSLILEVSQAEVRRELDKLADLS
jgi:hypothetical protein